MKRTYEPHVFLERAYKEAERRLALQWEGEAQWRRWRAALTRKLRELLGGFDDPVCPMRAEVLERNKMKGYVREKVVFQSRPDTSVPAWVLIPDKGAPPYPTMICLHGHGRGKDSIIGIAEDGTERTEPGEYQQDFAVQAVRRGYLAIAPEQFGFGERRNAADIKEGAGKSSCRPISMNGLMLGRTTIGMRVWDAMRVLDYLRSRKEVDPKRIGCMGISGGGTTTLFAAALDERIAAALVSGYLNTFRTSIMAMTHCEDNYIPAILKWAEMPDIAALIAPRPLFVESGTKDGIFPIAATRAAIRGLRQLYRSLGHVDRFGYEILDAGHEFSGRKGWPFLNHWLKKQPR
jgi:dienelactone hydrolase